MAAVMETTYFRQRLRQMENNYQHDNSTLSQCDCTSYSYFILSLTLFTVGTVITILAIGDAHDYIFYSLGHMWLVGPIFICSGLMVAVKSVLYLRKKYLIQMLLRQRALLRELAHQSRRHPITRNASTVTLPPPYESLLASPPPPPCAASSSQQGTSGTSNGAEMPPPTYEEAMFLFGDEKLLTVMLEEELKSAREEEAHHSGKSRGSNNYPDPPSSKP